MNTHFLPKMLFTFSIISFQTYTMEVDTLNNHKKLTPSQRLLTPINASMQASEIPESTSRYQNNYVTLLPVMTSCSNGLHLSVISPLRTADEKESHEQKDEIYEILSLHETKEDDIKENFSSKCLRCCIPLTKENIEELTKQNIDISVYRENKCKNNTRQACLGTAILTTGLGIIASFMYYMATH